MTTHSLSDGHLLRRVSAGDPEAARTMLMRHTSLVGWAIRERGIEASNTGMGIAIEDAESAGLEGLWRAILTYRGDSGQAGRPSAQFSTYAKRVIANAIEDAVRRANTERQRPVSQSVSLEDLEAAGVGLSAGGESSQGGDVEQRVLDELQFRADFARLRAVLTDQERAVLGAHLAGMTYAEISRETKSSYKAVDGAMQRIRRKAKQLT